MDVDHNPHNAFPVRPGEEQPKTNIGNICLPTKGRLEREHLYLWVVGEEEYVANKFDANREVQRHEHDDSMRSDGMSPGGFWYRSVIQYLDRARLALEGAAEMREAVTFSSNPERKEKFAADARFLEMKGQQALAKAFMNMKGCVESSIRVFGPLPKPGLSSGNIEEWV